MNRRFTRIAVCFLLGALPVFGRTCFLTTIEWHVWTPEGVIVGQSEIMWGCEDTGTGGGTGGGGGGGQTGGGGGGTTTEENEDPCIWINSGEFVTDLQDVIAFTEFLPFGEDPRRNPPQHNGMDMFASSGTPIYAPCDGTLYVGRQDVGRDCVGPEGSEGNWLRIQASGSWGSPPKGGGGQVVAGSVFQVYMAHLDENWANRAGIKSGMFVHKGDPIGWSDNTGAIQDLNAHLHLQYVDWEGNPVDPQLVADCLRN